MFDINIQHYESEHGEGTFPYYRSIKGQEKEEIIKLVDQGLGFHEAGSTFNLWNAIAEKGRHLDHFDAEDESFDLQAVFDHLGLSAPDDVYLFWYHFDEMDMMHLPDVIAHIDDIWYPSRDDLDIIDPDLAWAITITHYGAVYFRHLR